MEQQPSLEFKSFTSYYSTKNKFDCVCPLVCYQDLLDIQQTSENQNKIVNKIRMLEEEHRNMHVNVLKLINNMNDSIENLQQSKEEFVQMIRTEEKKCKSVLHRQVEEEIILGRIEVTEANILINMLKIKQKQRQQIQTLRTKEKQKQETSEKESPKQLDTTFQQQSFTDIQQLDNQSPFVKTYKTSVFENSYIVYSTKQYQIKSVKESDGITITIDNFDGKYRVISIDQGVPNTTVSIKWEQFGNGKFLSDCKIIPEQTEIPIPLPVNYLLEKRFSQRLRIDVLRSVREKLSYKKKLVMRNTEASIQQKLSQILKALEFQKYGDDHILIFTRVKGNNQLYMIEINPKPNDVEIIIRTSNQSLFFRDILQFMIFILSS